MKVNINAAKKLVERYDSITFDDLELNWEDLPEEEIEEDYHSGAKVLQNLTGFGSFETCTLCKEARELCKYPESADFCACCIYGHIVKCVRSPYYKEMAEADTPDELIQAIRKRSKYIKELIKEYEDRGE